ncbi:MAG: bifunctional adenosylcobinamide kinase/adenosylcobinamide-phosphate guanylyltransferase [Nitrospiraceae bacterium]|nr:bifunctional adenosylcobinamide kinase/adenosylcobinamide-phosphate guanylyltransferase [Nitrospiraceae bacterium]
MKKIIFIIGGARSGKSRFALAEASKIKGRRLYIATAQAFDEEMKERIEKHKKHRGKDWETYEEPLEITEVIKTTKGKYDVFLIDCLTLWLSNLLMNKKNTTTQIEKFISSLSDVKYSVFIVSNEVGMGIVPENKLARQFRDLAGILNQKIAAIADEVYLVAAGMPIKIKDKK